MRQRPFGTTGLELSELGFGTMRFAAKEPGDDDVSRAGMRALDEALHHGVTLVHSSYEYGTRWAVGRVLKDHPERDAVQHAIKVNVPDWGEASFSKDAFRRQVEDALRELHADRIAIVQHLQRGDFPKAIGYAPDTEPRRIDELDAVLEPLREVTDDLRQEGVLGHLTTFPYTVGYARAALASGAFDGVVAFFNALETEMSDLFDDLRRDGRGFVGIRPLLGGLLTDARHDRTRLSEDDPRHEPLWDRLYDQLADAKARLDPKPDSWTEFALKIALADPAIASTVVSIDRPERLHQMLGMLEGDRPGPDLLRTLHEVTRAYRAEHGATANGSGLPVYAS
ncbi:MAG: aldo/keto reductase [Trueperaceae bacterium]